MEFIQTTINKITKFDHLQKKINLKKFNNEEQELLKYLCYINQQLNFSFFYKKIKFKLVYFLLIRFYRIIIFFISIFKSNNILKKKTDIPYLKTEIAFLFFHPSKDLLDCLPIVKAFKKKIIIIDGDEIKSNELKDLFKNTKIINIRNYITLKDYILGAIKTLFFLKKFFIINLKYGHLLLNFNIYLSFFAKANVYRKLVKNLDTKKVFIDRNNGIAADIFLKEFKKINKKNKIFSYSLNGLALNNDLISSHYLYSNIDCLFCYGQFDKIFIKKLFKSAKSKFLKIPQKIIPVGSIRNYYFKLNKRKRRINKINFLYIKSNSFIYNNLDYYCFKNFCIFVKKNFKNFRIMVKEKNIDTSKNNNILIKQNLIYRKDIYTSSNLTPEKIFKKADIVVGTTSAALSQAIYYDIPVICLDNKIVISSFLKYFSDIYIMSIDIINSYKKKN